MCMMTYRFLSGLAPVLDVQSSVEQLKREPGVRWNVRSVTLQECLLTRTIEQKQSHDE